MVGKERIGILVHSTQFKYMDAELLLTDQSKFSDRYDDRRYQSYRVYTPAVSRSCPETKVPDEVIVAAAVGGT